MTRRAKRLVRMIPAPPDPSLPAGPTSACRWRATRGTLPDDRLLYLVAILRDTPVPAPALSPEE